MVELVTVARLVGGVLLLLFNGFFVTTEFALTRVPQFPEEEFTGHRGLERALEMTERLEIYLSGCQVGITIASVGLGVVAEPAVSAVVDAGLRAAGVGGGGQGHLGASVVVSLAVINVLHVVVGEQTPTYLGVERSKWVAMYLAPPLYWWTKLMSPVIRFADWTAKAILRAFGVTITRSWSEVEGEGEEGGEAPAGAPSVGEVKTEMARRLGEAGLSEERREEVLNAIEIGETPVSEILIPRDEMVILADDDTRENLRKIRENPQFTRFPLFDEANAESAIGVVYVSAVLNEVEALREGTMSMADIATPPLSIDAETPISEAIDIFQAENQELALVVEEGRIVGLLTASDAFEAIAGELEDPLDEGATA